MPKLKQFEEQTINYYNANDMQLLTPKELSQKIKISEKILQTLRIKGGGPKFFKRSNSKRALVLYDWKDVLVYLESHKRISTSDTGDSK